MELHVQPGRRSGSNIPTEAVNPKPDVTKEGSCVVMFN